MLTGIPNWSLDYFGMPVIYFLLERGIIERIPIYYYEYKVKYTQFVAIAVKTIYNIVNVAEF